MTDPKSSLAQIRQFRIDKVSKLRELGIDPYPSKSRRSHYSGNIIDNFEILEGKEVTVSGRLMSWREHGHLVFGHLQDSLGQIQLYIHDEKLKDTNIINQNIGFEYLNLLDVGDIVEATGIVTKTKRGEISVQPSEVKILTKAIRPLPDKWEGIKDKETLFRQRYLDMIMNPQNRWRFEKGAQIVFAIREFLNHRGYLEIKTPIIQSVYGGTNAKPFKTHVNALGTDYYLAVAHELYLKRLITAGFDNVYNIAGYFRNEGIDRSHNPEFNMLETMSAFNNYEYNMDLIESMYKYIGEKVFQKTNFKILGQEVDFGKPWEKISMLDAVKKYANIDFNSIKSLEDAHKVLDSVGYKDKKPESIGESMVKVFEEKVEEKLIQPTFITGHPVEISPLAKSMASDPRFVERFEIFMGGIEGGDNWTELNDPVELYKRFSEQVERGRGGDDEFHPMDVDFIECMEYGMPPTTGLGPGIERLQMMYLETEYIDDVTFFPMQRPAQVSKIQKEIYGEEYLLDRSEYEDGSAGKKENNFKSKTQDKSQKMVLIIRKDLTGWQLTNTIGHLTAFLGSKIGENNLQSKSEFITKEGEKIPANSQYPIITLTAKSSEQLYNLLLKIEEESIEYLAYTQDMIDFNDDLELTEIYSKQEKKSLDYIGIGVFGHNESIDKLTKKFSMLK